MCVFGRHVLRRPFLPLFPFFFVTWSLAWPSRPPTPFLISNEFVGIFWMSLIFWKKILNLEMRTSFLSFGVYHFPKTKVLCVSSSGMYFAVGCCSLFACWGVSKFVGKLKIWPFVLLEWKINFQFGLEIFSLFFVLDNCGVDFFLTCTELSTTCLDRYVM